jgi:hypothetical protein
LFAQKKFFMRKFLLFLFALSFFSFAESQPWSTKGNAGTNPATDFLGTTDNKPLRFRINNLWAGELDSGSSRTFFGYGAGKNTIPGTQSVGFGLKALFSTSRGQYNSAFGNLSLFSNTIGNYNNAFGYGALYSNQEGSYENAFGYQALYNNLGAQGDPNGKLVGSFNDAFGYQALYSNTTGFGNGAMGYQALYNNTVGNGNEALGSNTLFSNTTGGDNVAVGNQALKFNTTGGGNVAVGATAMIGNFTGSNNTACGDAALQLNQSGQFNTAIGSSSQPVSSGGSYNTSVGSFSLGVMQNANNNTAVGYNALSDMTSSSNNIAVGYQAGSTWDLGDNNIIIGANSQGSFAGQYNFVALGSGLVVPNSNEARIGNTATTSIGGWADWSNFSDGRYKKDIQQNVIGIDFIMKLKPITYRLDVTALSKTMKENGGKEWNGQMKAAVAEKEKMVLTGFIAQDVEQAAKESGFDFSGVDKPEKETGLYALRYAEFVVPLVKAVQEQQELIKTLQDKVEKLQTDVAIVIRENIVNEKISAYPNPTANNMTIAITTQTPGDGTLQIFDAAGKLIRQMNISIQKGGNQINVDMPNVATGSYDIKLDWGKDMHKHISIIKQ